MKLSDAISIRKNSNINAKNKLSFPAQAEYNSVQRSTATDEAVKKKKGGGGESSTTINVLNEQNSNQNNNGAENTSGGGGDGGGGGGDGTAGTLGGIAGTTAGTFVGGPIGGLVGGALGRGLGNAIGGGGGGGSAKGRFGLENSQAYQRESEELEQVREKIETVSQVSIGGTPSVDADWEEWARG